MKNETLIHIELDNLYFTANMILVSEVGQRREVLLCEDCDVSKMGGFIAHWATFATFTFAPC